MQFEGLESLSMQKAKLEMNDRLDTKSFTWGIIKIYNYTLIGDQGLQDRVVRLTMDHLKMLRSRDEEAVSRISQNSLLKSVSQFTLTCSWRL